MASPIVQTDCGSLEGASLPGHCFVFKGISFAKPPVGKLRWRPPQPLDAWDGVRRADSFGAAPVQPPLPDDSIMRQFSFATPPECSTGEDCLYLNIWTGGLSTDEKRPVIVWIFGGGHRVGSGSHPVSDGSYLALKGAVVVSVNYRLGALGYLAHPRLTQESGASGNYASLDIVAALEWISRNIRAFGGDPDCVTLFGQSAGAAHVGVLAASSLARGLFHRVIVHSSGRFKGGPMGAPMKTLDQAEQEGARLLSDLGAASLDDLRGLAADSMVGPRGFWNPIVDGVVLRDNIQAVFERNEHAAVPVLAGYTADEAAPYAQEELHTVRGLSDHALKTYGKDASRFLALYPHSSDDEARQSSYWLRRDTAFAYQPFKYCQFASRAGMEETFLFNFTRNVPLPQNAHFHEKRPPLGYGAYHGSELWYVFNTLRSQPWDWSDGDHEMAEQMSHYWLTFARNGDPNFDGAPKWPRFNVSSPTAMRFGETIEAGEPINLAELQFHDAYFNSQTNFVVEK